MHPYNSDRKLTPTLQQTLISDSNLVPLHATKECDNIQKTSATLALQH